jgi:Ion channel
MKKNKLQEYIINYNYDIFLYLFSTLILLIITLYNHVVFNFIKNRSTFICFYIGLAVYVIIAMAFSIVSALKTFKKATKKAKIILIIHSYCTIIFVYSCIYFSSVLITDFVNQAGKAKYYDKLNQLKMTQPKFEVIYINYEGNNAFNNLNRKPWFGYDNFSLISLNELAKKDTVFRKYYNAKKEGLNKNILYNLHDNLRASQLLGSDNLIKFDNQSIGSVFLDCVYFSLITSTTIGYGDITPACEATKALVISHIILNLILLFVSLNFALNFND